MPVENPVKRKRRAVNDGVKVLDLRPAALDVAVAAILVDREHFVSAQALREDVLRVEGAEVPV